jgi:hypothetical protein
MSKLLLPEELRPKGVRYRQCEIGVDLPGDFLTSLRGIDEHLYPVFHPYRILWDSIINGDAGELEDPRFQIHVKYGELNFGHVLTDGDGCPTPDGTWHIWRLCRPHGWAHVINIDSTDRLYLDLLCKRLWLQATYNDKYGHKGYTKLLEQMDLEKREKEASEKQDLFNEISKTNSAMMSRAMDNYSRGVVKATNPQKESIINYPGQVNHSKTVRPLSDKEGGLILPPGFGDE